MRRVFDIYSSLSQAVADWVIFHLDPIAHPQKAECLNTLDLEWREVDFYSRVSESSQE
jgi:hypothetical protein